VDDIGIDPLDPNVPLLPVSAFQPAKQHIEITVDLTIFDRYLARYQLAPKFILTITREGDHLFGQATGQPKLEMFAQSENS
jgi:serine-type D-Ala-D-Ala carboxypeptidase/endopeptidase